MVKALTIAGSDTSGGAGIQADLKTFQELDVYGMTALTVIVAQNPATGWGHDIYPIDPAVIEAQINTVLGGISVNALKTGMLPTTEIVQMVGRKLVEYNCKNIVIDPVMVCKGTEEVVNPDVADSLREHLLPLADVITPNVYEATQLSGVRQINSVEKLKEAAVIIHKLGAKNVFIKGGTKLGTPEAIDLFFDGNTFTLLESPLVPTQNTHGAGCTTAAAITAYLAKGYSVKDAVEGAKQFVTKAIAQGFRLNEYVGAVRHSAHRQS